MMTDPWYPGAVKRPLSYTQSAIKPRLAILHTNGASGHTASLFNYYNSTKTQEAHFQVARSGVGEQYVPVNMRADTNSAGNSFTIDGITYGAVTCESEDLGWTDYNVGNSTPWTDGQLDFIAGALVWLHQEWGIPIVKVPTWDGAGIGLHRDFPQWTQWPASTYPYKACPGDAKTAQFPALLAEVERRLAPPPPTPVLTEVADMAVRNPIVRLRGTRAVYVHNTIARRSVVDELGLRQTVYELGLADAEAFSMSRDELFAKFVVDVDSLNGYGALVT